MTFSPISMELPHHPSGKWLLLPLAWLYRLLLSLRSLYFKAFHPPEKLGRPTIKVGNITVGGTGKTPFVIYLAKLLKKRNVQPVVLTRGYGRRSSGLIKVTGHGGSRSNAELAGDEPQLISQQVRCPVYVCEDRRVGAKAALQEYPCATFILDDAYQQLGIHSDVSFLLIDATNPFDNGCLLPAGKLREPIPEIRRADAFVVTRADHPFDQDWLVETLKKHNHAAPLFFAYNEAVGLREVSNGAWSATAEFRGKSVMMMCAIGSPAIFQTDIAHHQMLIQHRLLFPDHHFYTQSDIDRALLEAAAHAADVIVTTEKDAVKLEGLKIPPKTIYALGIEARVDEEESFLEFLKMVLDI